MPLKGMLLIFLIVLTACWWFRKDIYAFFKGVENSAEPEEKQENKESEE